MSEQAKNVKYAFTLIQMEDGSLSCGGVRNIPKNILIRMLNDAIYNIATDSVVHKGESDG